MQRPGAMVLAFVLVAVAAVAPARARAQALRRKTDFTEDERAALAAGELVTRPVTERRGSRKLFGGTSWQVVDLPSEAVWRALHDLRRYREMLPRVATSREVGDQGGVRTVYIEHESGAIDASYYINVRFSSGRNHAFFKLDRDHPSSIRSAWGFMRIASWDDGKSLVSFGIMADVGDGLINGIVRPQVHKWMLRVPRTFKKYVEGKGRRRYLDS